MVPLCIVGNTQPQERRSSLIFTLTEPRSHFSFVRETAKPHSPSPNPSRAVCTSSTYRAAGGSGARRQGIGNERLISFISALDETAVCVPLHEHHINTNFDVNISFHINRSFFGILKGTEQVGLGSKAAH